MFRRSFELSHVRSKKLKEDSSKGNNSDYVSVNQPSMGHTPRSLIAKEAGLFVNYRFSLEETLGKNWKSEAILPDLNTTLDYYGIADIDNAYEPNPDTAETQIEKQVVQLNNILHKSSSPFSAKVIRTAEDDEFVYMTGVINGDKMFVLSRALNIEDSVNASAAIGVEALGFIGEHGVLDINRIHRQSRELFEGIVLIAKSSRKFNADMMITKKYSDSTADTGVITRLPDCVEDIGTLFHELGHQLRKRIILHDNELSLTRSVAGRVIEDIHHGQFPEYDLMDHGESPLLNSMEARKVHIAEERGGGLWEYSY